jgi:hypothetical protein
MHSAKSKIVQQRGKPQNEFHESKKVLTGKLAQSIEPNEGNTSTVQGNPAKIRKFPRPLVKSKHYREVKR